MGWSYNNVSLEFVAISPKLLFIIMWTYFDFCKVYYFVPIMSFGVSGLAHLWLGDMAN